MKIAERPIEMGATHSKNKQNAKVSKCRCFESTEKKNFKGNQR